MGVHIAHDRHNDVAIMYCSTTDWAFGPVFVDDDGHDADERVEAFLRWLKTTTGVPDPRSLTEEELQKAYLDWRAQETAQWAREEAARLQETD
jgi:hypothetical protein